MTQVLIQYLYVVYTCMPEMLTLGTNDVIHIFSDVILTKFLSAFSHSMAVGQHRNGTTTTRLSSSLVDKADLHPQENGRPLRSSTIVYP